MVACCLPLAACGEKNVDPAASAQSQDDSEGIELLDLIKIEVDYSALESDVRGIVDECEVANDAVIAVAFRGMGDRKGSFEINGSISMVSASMIKMSILAELLEEVGSGAVSFDQIVTVSAEDVVGGTGTGISPGQTLSVRELAKLMISESDNTASNALISLLGIDDINENATRIGLEATVLDHKLMSPNITKSNTVSADDLASIFEWIAEGELGDSDDDAAVVEFLIEQTDTEGLSEGIVSPWTFAHKTGSLSYARNDGGILYDSEGQAACIVVVLTNNMDEIAANAMMSRIATTVCDFMNAMDDADDHDGATIAEDVEFVSLR